MSKHVPPGPLGHLALAFGFIGRIHAIRHALDYDLRDLPMLTRGTDIAVSRVVSDRLLRTNMDAWFIATGREPLGRRDESRICDGEHAAPVCSDPHCYHGRGDASTRAFPMDEDLP